VIEIRCTNSGLAKQLANVLSPDNLGAPKKQRFSMSVSHSSLLFDFSTDTIDSLEATVDSILDDVGLFQEVWLLSSQGEGFDRRRA
jgi:hypothetical protein